MEQAAEAQKAKPRLGDLQMTGGSGGRGEVFFEFVTVGNHVKVTAIDAASGIEVVAIGPVSASQQHMEQLALRKLLRRLKER